jgi:HEAT repeat protein
LLAWPDANSALTLQLLRIIGLIKNPDGAPLAVSAAVNSPPEVRVAAVRTLGQIASTAPEIIESILPVLIRSCQDPFWPVQAQAARSLGVIGNEAAVDALLSLLSHEQWWVRGNATSALACCGGRGMQALADIAENSDDTYARERAREELGGGVARS